MDNEGTHLRPDTREFKRDPVQPPRQEDRSLGLAFLNASQSVLCALIFTPYGGFQPAADRQEEGWVVSARILGEEFLLTEGDRLFYSFHTLRSWSRKRRGNWHMYNRLLY